MSGHRARAAPFGRCRLLVAPWLGGGRATPAGPGGARPGGPPARRDRRAGVRGAGRGGGGGGLGYTREIAFGAGQVYARTAEARGAWDARLEALVVDSLVRGGVDEDLQSWASALNWSAGPVAVIVGLADGSEPEGLIDELRIIARRARLDLLAGVHGHRLVIVLGGTSDPVKAAAQSAARFGAGPVVAGRPVGTLQRAPLPASAARAGLRAAAAWPDAPRPVEADDLLPERALDGDQQARAQLLEEVYEPLLRGGSALLDTVMTYLEQGNSLEATARLLFVHPNTVRYRLPRGRELN